MLEEFAEVELADVDVIRDAFKMRMGVMAIRGADRVQWDHGGLDHSGTIDVWWLRGLEELSETKRRIAAHDLASAWRESASRRRLSAAGRSGRAAASVALRVDLGGRARHLGELPLLGGHHAARQFGGFEFLEASLGLAGEVERRVAAAAVDGTLAVAGDRRGVARGHARAGATRSTRSVLMRRVPILLGGLHQLGEVRQLGRVQQAGVRELHRALVQRRLQRLGQRGEFFGRE